MTVDDVSTFDSWRLLPVKIPYLNYVYTYSVFLWKSKLNFKNLQRFTNKDMCREMYAITKMVKIRQNH